MRLQNTFNIKKTPYIIAEIGVNHNGSIIIAKKLIDHAKKSGCNAIKFQTFKTELVTTKQSPLANYQKKLNSKNMFDLLKKLELSYEQFSKLKKYCNKINIDFISTPFDEESADFLNKINISSFKISSGDNENFFLLKKIKSFKKPTILSLGMVKEKQIEKIINFLNFKKNQLALLHCISEYPTELQDTQLNQILNLRKYGYTVGWSDHSLGETASSIAVALGAKIIEKHITLDKKMKGPDHSISLETKFLPKFVEKLKKSYRCTLNKKRFFTKNERQNIFISKKGLYYNDSLKKNEITNQKSFIFLRPQKNSFSPLNLKRILNKKINKNVNRFDLVKLSHYKK